MPFLDASIVPPRAKRDARRPKQNRRPLQAKPLRFEPLEHRLVLNNAPVANNDSYSVVHDRTLQVMSPGVLANDTDWDGPQWKTAWLYAPPSHGSLTLNSNGSFTYVPDEEYVGSDSFQYRAYDGLAYSNVATVTINVTNATPTANNDSYQVQHDQQLNVSTGGLLANDSDGDMDPITASLYSQPEGGTLNLNANGTFTYNPPSGFAGQITFQYQASDGISLSTPATVTITVNNQVPVANADTYYVRHDRQLQVSNPGVLANDSDGDGDLLSAVLVTDVNQGTLTLNANGSFTYDPPAGVNGQATFQNKAFYGVAYSGVVTVTIHITNEPPVADNDSYQVKHDRQLQVNAPGVLVNDIDTDPDPITAVLVSGPSHGSLTLNPNGSFIYSPSQNYVGEDSFTYRASDGLTTSNLATVTITVTNEPPVAHNDFYPFVGSYLFVDDPGVLLSDEDPDADALKATLVSGPYEGLFYLSEQGGFLYIPDPEFVGIDTFVYKARDGIADDNATVYLFVQFTVEEMEELLLSPMGLWLLLGGEAQCQCSCSCDEGEAEDIAAENQAPESEGAKPSEQD